MRLNWEIRYRCYSTRDATIAFATVSHLQSGPTRPTGCDITPVRDNWHPEPPAPQIDPNFFLPISNLANWLQRASHQRFKSTWWPRWMTSRRSSRASTKSCNASLTRFRASNPSNRLPVITWMHCCGRWTTRHRGCGGSSWFHLLHHRANLLHRYRQHGYSICLEYGSWTNDTPICVSFGVAQQAPP